MVRLPQFIRNFFIRIEGFLTVFLKIFTNFIKNAFGFFVNIFGYNSSTSFLESDDAQSIKRISTKEIAETKQDNTAETSTTKRRRPEAKMDYYLKMAREIKKN
ncbi:threonine dehydratase [Nostoc sp. CENA67]|uniref:Threonine dehydratase n=1 Tax=Amazonocrinis nigriterrae CENA67 TaxID=2794033 RepID=A0A8J7HSW1_9NOST|nr:threonine dehydratase [Amazonocrinis nigriterrae]MBH8561794.1 threonine dehydratase [Amazonocrinis nigriterrae CENA67]